MAAFGLVRQGFTSRTEPICEYYNHQWRRDKPTEVLELLERDERKKKSNSMSS